MNWSQNLKKGLKLILEEDKRLIESPNLNHILLEYEIYIWSLKNKRSLFWIKNINCNWRESFIFN
jgi:hypothetical protein